MTTDAEHAAKAEGHFRATTVSYSTWKHKVATGQYTPKDGSTTEWGQGFHELTLIGDPVPPTPTGFVTRGLWDFTPGGANGANWPVQTSQGYNLMFAEINNPNWLKSLAPNNQGIWLQANPFNPETGTFKYDQALADSWIQGVIDTAPGALKAIYISDEPSILPGKDVPGILKATSDHYHQKFPGIETLISLWNYGDVSTFAHCCDAVVMDGYPISTNTNTGVRTFDKQSIARQAKACEDVNWKYYAAIQAFAAPGGSDWEFSLPTVDELTQMCAMWGATHMAGYMVYVWGTQSPNPGDAFQLHPDLVAVLKKFNQTWQPKA